MISDSVTRLAPADGAEDDRLLRVTQQAGAPAAEIGALLRPRPGRGHAASAARDGAAAVRRARVPRRLRARPDRFARACSRARSTPTSPASSTCSASCCGSVTRSTATGCASLCSRRATIRCEQLTALTRAHVRIHATYPLLTRLCNRELGSLLDEDKSVVLAIRLDANRLFLDVVERGQRLGAFTPSTRCSRWPRSVRWASASPSGGAPTSASALKRSRRPTRLSR